MDWHPIILQIGGTSNKLVHEISFDGKVTSKSLVLDEEKLVCLSETMPTNITEVIE